MCTYYVLSFYVGQKIKGWVKNTSSLREFVVEQMRYDDAHANDYDLK